MKSTEAEKNQQNRQSKRRTETLTFPAILVYETTPPPEAITIPRVASVAYIEEHVVEEGLESRNRSAFNV